MGVKGLWKYLCAKNVILKTIKLSEIARKRAPLEQVLVCDLMAVFYWVIERVYTAKVKSGDYPIYAAIYGGDFNDYRKRLEGFVDALRHIGIEPMFFMDGPTNVDTTGPSLRQCKTEERYKKSLTCMDVYTKVCNYDPKTEVIYKKKVNKVLLFTELVQTLKMKRVDVISCHGQADTLMARYAHANKEKVCGILTNDTDLAFMPSCPMIHVNVFDFENDLKLNNARNMEVRPREIVCKVLTTEILAHHFGIDEACLPALSILCGNDFTAHLNRKCGISKLFGHPVQKTATSFIQRNPVACRSSNGFLQIKEIEETLLLVGDHADNYKKAVDYSYTFYCCSRSSDEIVFDYSDSSDDDESKNDISDSDISVNEDNVEKSHDDEDNDAATAVLQHTTPGRSRENTKLHLRITRLDYFLLSLNYRNVTIWRNKTEQLDPGQPCIHKITQPVRELMYRLTQAEVIEEWGQQSVSQFTKVTLCPQRLFDTSVIANLKQLPAREKLYFVFFAMCRKDVVPKDKYQYIPDSYKCSINTILICSSLIFAKQHGVIPEEYIMPVLLACVSCTRSSTPPPTTSRPGPKGVTIAAQFMTILQHARWLASLIGIHPLPLPSLAFQPYVYIPLHDVAFKMSQKEKFCVKKMVALKTYYDSMVKEKAIIDLEKFIRCCKHAKDEDDVYSNFMDFTTKFEGVGSH